MLSRRGGTSGSAPTNPSSNRRLQPRTAHSRRSVGEPQPERPASSDQARHHQREHDPRRVGNSADVSSAIVDVWIWVTFAVLIPTNAGMEGTTAWREALGRAPPGETHPQHRTHRTWSPHRIALGFNRIECTAPPPALSIVQAAS